MRMNSLAALAALSMIAAGPAIAQSAAPLSIAPATRAADGPQGSNELVGTTAWILAAIGLGLIIWGIIELTSDEDDFPTSP